MSRKYKFADNDRIYFVSFAVIAHIPIRTKAVLHICPNGGQDVKHSTINRYFAVVVIETYVFQMPQLHKHFNVGDI